MTLLTSLLSAIMPILLGYLSDRMGSTAEPKKEKRDGLRAIQKAKTGVEVASAWKRHDDRVARLLLKAKAKRR